ncbi:hypothetical protein AAHS21_07760 [Mycobacterium sp. 050272]|uniref:hypothetical protein n=1 Tax=Mycobacterium sp. 050272 TaxID=3142488 RepID=UPI0031929B0A
MSTEDDPGFPADALSFTPIAADDEPDHVMRTCQVCSAYFPTQPGSVHDRAARCRTHLLVTHALMRREAAGWVEYDHDPYTHRELDSPTELTQACRGWLDTSGITAGEWKLEARDPDTGDRLAQSEVVDLTEKSAEKRDEGPTQAGSEARPKGFEPLTF